MKNNQIKVIFLGESGVGKTNLINATIGEKFNEIENTTFANYFVEKKFEINNQEYILHIWDTIGQERFRHLTKLYFKESKIVILVYDKSIKKTFEELNYWKEEVKKLLGDDIVLAVVGNKDDLDEEDVDENEAREFANNLNAKFKMVSAKINGKGFENFMKELLIEYIKKTGGNIEKDDRIILDKKKMKEKKKSKC